VQTEVVDHPLLADTMAVVRDRDTDGERFAAAVDRAATLLLTAASARLPTRLEEVATPLGPANCRRLAEQPVLVPVLRAGLGLLPAARALFPAAPVAFVGLRRDEATAEPHWYLDALPERLADRHVIVLEPMLATGGTMVQVLGRLAALGALQITLVALICAPAGLAQLERGAAGLGIELRVVVGAADPGLDDRNFIFPGLGDAGDRLFGAL